MLIVCFVHRRRSDGVPLSSAFENNTRAPVINEQMYEVEKIVSSKQDTAGKTAYRVRWLGYSAVSAPAQSCQGLG